MNWIYNLSYEGLKELILAENLKKFAADQIFQWIYGKNVQDIELWTNISKADRERLSQILDTRLPEILKVSTDRYKTQKILVELEDQHRIECVLIPEKHHFTFCISTQVGCPLKCKFCATGNLGFKRNLTPGEILSQILLLKKHIPGYTDKPYSGKLNIVLMGMGEPLLNYENLKQALNIITSERGIGISPRNVTLSTSGILNELRRFETDFPKLKISFSLNASDAKSREDVMPISKSEKLDRLLEYFRNTKERRKHRVTFEYVLLKGVNDSLEDARKVAELLRGIPSKVNVIPFNENEWLPFRTPSDETVESFSDYLHSKGYTVIVRWSKGRDIRSACGQLAGDDWDDFDEDED